MIKENRMTLDQLKSLETPHLFNVGTYKFEYEEDLEKELKELGIELDHLRLENMDRFEISIVPSRESHIRQLIVLGKLELNTYTSAEEYSKLEEEYKKSGDNRHDLLDWLFFSGKLKHVKITIPPGDFVYIFLRSFSRGGFYNARRGWHIGGLSES